MTSRLDNKNKNATEALASALWRTIDANPDLAEEMADHADPEVLRDLATNFFTAVPLVQAIYGIDPTKPITKDTALLTAEHMTDTSKKYNWSGPLIDQGQYDLIVAYTEEDGSLFADCNDDDCDAPVKRPRDEGADEPTKRSRTGEEDHPGPKCLCEAAGVCTSADGLMPLASLFKEDPCAHCGMQPLVEAAYHIEDEGTALRIMRCLLLNGAPKHTIQDALYVSPSWRRALLLLLHGATPESCKTGQPVPFFEEDYRVGAALDEQAQLLSSLFAVFEKVIGEKVIGSTGAVSLGAVVETGETGEIVFPSSSSSLGGPATIVVKFATTATTSGSYEHRAVDLMRIVRVVAIPPMV